jgi:hypothetical protein
MIVSFFYNQIVPPGSESDCADGQFLCPAPMYMKGGEYLGAYSNNEVITPAGTMSDENFGLDDYEPEFFLDPLTWNTAGEYSIALKFDVDDFTDDIFYFCHVSSIALSILFHAKRLVVTSFSHTHTTNASYLLLLFYL